VKHHFDITKRALKDRPHSKPGAVTLDEQDTRIISPNLNFIVAIA
jgi:hypothetical protein